MKPFLPITVFFITIISFSQTKFSGKIKGEKNNPIPNANVYIDGTYDGAKSNNMGEFSFSTSAEGNQTLVITSLVSAQGQFEQGMGKAFQLWGEGKNTEASAMFERIAAVEKNSCLPNYYVALVNTTTAFGTKDKILQERQGVGLQNIINRYQVTVKAHSTYEFFLDGKLFQRHYFGELVCWLTGYRFLAGIYFLGKTGKKEKFRSLWTKKKTKNGSKNSF
jgi:hypothetical protein